MNIKNIKFNLLKDNYSKYERWVKDSWQKHKLDVGAKNSLIFSEGFTPKYTMKHLKYKHWI